MNIKTSKEATNGVHDDDTNNNNNLVGATVGVAAQGVKDAATFLWSPSVEPQEKVPSINTTQGEEARRILAQDVILRIEITTSREARTASYFTFLLCTLAVAVVIIESLIKYYRNPEISLFKNDNFFIASAAISVALLILLCFAMVMYCIRVWQTFKAGQSWTYRRKYMSIGAFTILSVQILITAVGLADNIYLIITDCSWFTAQVIAMGYVQWTLWNVQFLLYLIASHSVGFWTGKVQENKKKKGQLSNEDERDAVSPEEVIITNTATTADTPISNDSNHSDASSEASSFLPPKPEPSTPPALVMDAPWRIHLFKIPVFAAFQVLFTLMFVNSNKNLYKLDQKLDELRQEQTITDGTCPGNINFECTAPDSARILALFLVLIVAWYCCVHLYFWHRTSHNLKTKAFAQTRMVRVLHSISFFQITLVYLALVFSVALTILLKIDSCWTYIFVWTGVLGMLLAGSCTAIVLSYYMMPRNATSAKQVVQTWLQEFAWTEDTRQDAINERNGRLPASESLQKEPMMCLETVIKLSYWCRLAYTLGEPNDDGLFKVDVGLKQYNLTDYKIIRNTRVDSKAIVAYGAPGNKTIIIAFKGTSSRANVKTDLDYFPMTQPPTRFYQAGKGVATRYLKTLVSVHRGFWASFIADGYNEEVIDALEEACTKIGVTPVNARVLFTGHSLGGALATLAAQAWTQKHADAGQFCELVTLGSPRVGNKPFAYEYNSKMPNHWGIVCGKDPIPTIPKGFLYKRCGERVALNKNGDIIVRPSFLEKEVNFGASNNPSDHFLVRYRGAICAIIKAQFSSLNIPGGYEGVLKLSKAMDLKQMLRHENMDLKSLADPTIKPISFESLQEVAKEAKQVRGFGCHCSADCMGGVCAGQVCMPLRKRKDKDGVHVEDGEEMHELSKTRSAGGQVPVADHV